MASRLSQVRNWEERARKAGFSVSILSIHCGVSRRQLLNFIRTSFGITPHQWMVRVRMELAGKLLQQGFYVKEVSSQLGFKQVAHFCREFKRYYGLPPGHFSLSRLETRDSHLDKEFSIR
jgi:AraC family transcriptional regulator